MWKNHRLWFITFSVISCLGIVDMATKSAEFMAGSDLGVVTLATSWLLALPFMLFSQTAGALAMAVYATALDLVFSLVILWIPIAFYEHKQMRKQAPTVTGATPK